MSDVTRILSQIHDGDPSAAEQLLPLVYGDKKGTGVFFEKDPRPLFMRLFVRPLFVTEPRFHKTGHDEPVYAQADGKIRIERPGHDSGLLETPRPFARPYLGEGPRLTLEVVESDDDKPCRIRFRAVAEIGTGEWSGERPEPLIHWEIYNPDGTVSPSLFPEYGAERMLRVEDNVPHTMRHPIPEQLLDDSMKQKAPEGFYTVRAATADVFGRPAVAYKTVYVDVAGE